MLIFNKISVICWFELEYSYLIMLIHAKYNCIYMSDCTGDS